jgi:hypothetical protein
MPPAECPLDYVIAVQLAVGSRFIEVARVSEYTDNGDGQIRIVGVAKDKGEKETREKKIVVKPVIRLTPARIVDMVSCVRSYLEAFKDLSLRQLSNRFIPKINKRIKELFPETFTHDGKAATSHFLRAIYGNLSWKIFTRDGETGVGLQYWLSRVLGHKADSIETAQSYSTIQIRGHADPLPPISGGMAISPSPSSPPTVGGEGAAMPHTVPFLNRLNEVVELPREQKMRDGEKRKMGRVEQAVKMMEEKKITVSKRKLAALGFGSRIISAYWEKNKKPCRRKRKNFTVKQESP